MTFGCNIKSPSRQDIDDIRRWLGMVTRREAQSPAPDEEDKYLLDDGRCYVEVDIITLVSPRYGGPYGNRVPGKLEPVARGPVLGWHFVGCSRWVRCDVVVTREVFWYGYGEPRRETEGVAQCMMFSTPYTAAWREAECWAFDRCIRECCR